MRPESQLKNRQLNRKLIAFRELAQLQQPSKGWISEIRRALGMTALQLGRRLDVSQPAVTQYEKSEASGSITLGTLRSVADALECELVYALVPRTDLLDIRERQARRIAESAVTATAHSMGLERQQVSAEEIEEQVKDLTNQILEENPRSLWNEP